MTEQQRATRNLNPHAEAIMAMNIWGYEYSKFGGGSMDFWDKLSKSKKLQCKETVDRILKSERA